MTQAYIVDVDGTVADLAHRVHHHGRDHAAFEAGVPDDAPIIPVIKIVRALHEHGYAIVFTSGRTERTRDATVAWFNDYSVPYDALYMRATGDTRPDHIVKRQLLDGIRADGYDIIGVIDDRQSVVDMWREEGLTCLQCAPNTIVSGYQTPDGVRPTLTVMVGPAGSGKTTWLAGDIAREEYGIHPQHVIASDQVRLDLFGTLRCQDKNNQVFEAVRAAAKARLKSGLPTVIDATHIRDRARRESAELACGLCPVRYIVIDRPVPDKLATAGWRLDIKFEDGSNLITRHDRVFRSNIRAIMRGDSLPNVTVYDEMNPEQARVAA